MKAKLGISVGLLGAMMVLTAGFGGYMAMIILGGYILMFEENEWLKKTAVKAVAIAVVFDFVLALIGLVPGLFDWIQRLVVLFNGEFSYVVLNRIINIITSALNLIQTCLFLMFGLKALNQGNIPVPVVDKLISKYM